MTIEVQEKDILNLIIVYVSNEYQRVAENNGLWKNIGKLIITGDFNGRVGGEGEGRLLGDRE